MGESYRSHAVVMVSGGLDSILSVLILREQLIRVTPVNFDMGFSQATHKKRVPPKKTQPSGIDIMRELGIEVVTLDVAEDFFREIILYPQHGYGKEINPCIDCKIYMQKKAWEYTQAIGADFLATGEVLGQRPMSQVKRKLLLIEKESGLSRRIVRPLSAKLLPITEAEEKGLVDRELLYGIEGRHRNFQFDLARKFGLSRFPTPAGGCFLAESQTAARLFDLFDYVGKDNIEFTEAELVKVGGHFRLSPDTRLIVGRNMAENAYMEEMLKKLKRAAAGLDAQKNPGPFAIIIGENWRSHLDLALSILARYCDKRDEAEITLKDKNGTVETIFTVAAADDTLVDSYRIAPKE